MARPRKIFITKGSAEAREWNAERSKFLAEWRATPDDTSIMRRGQGAKHPDRPLPGWAMALQCMVDGRWYGRPHIVMALSDMKDTAAAGGLSDCYRKGYVRRAGNPKYDPDALGGFDGPRMPGARGSFSSLPYSAERRLRRMRWVYQITDKGRHALGQSKRKYGVS